MIDQALAVGGVAKGQRVKIRNTIMNGIEWCNP